MNLHLPTLSFLISRPATRCRTATASARGNTETEAITMTTNQYFQWMRDGTNIGAGETNRICISNFYLVNSKSFWGNYKFSFIVLFLFLYQKVQNQQSIKKQTFVFSCLPINHSCITYNIDIFIKFVQTKTYWRCNYLS